MILKDYIYHICYLKKPDGSITTLEEYDDNYEGYYQEHPAGELICDLNLTSIFRLGDKSYDINSIEKIEYSSQGEARTVEIAGKNNSLDRFEYEVFWIEEDDMLELAFELPEDIERDLLKYVAEKFKEIRR